jgi:hypothetical protein
MLTFLLFSLSFASPLDSLSWLTGTWVREAGDSYAEEVWGPNHQGLMVGHFRLHEGGKVQFLELSTLTEMGDGAVLRIRHHDVALQPWEHEPVATTFFASDLKGSEVVFRSDTDRAKEFVLVNTSAQELTIRLVWRDGSPPAEFPFTRKK